MGFQVLDSTGKIKTSIIAVDAATITSGILPDARMPNLTGDVTTVEGAVATTLANIPAISGVNLTNLNATNLASGVAATARGGTSVDIASAALPLGSGQITFPATQNASAGVNVLDDYEEGTWTPEFQGSGGQSGQVYSEQTGNYIKVGKKVLLTGRITLSTLGTITGGLYILQAPFNAAALSTVHIGYFGSFTTPIVWIGGFLSGVTILVYIMSAAATNPSAAAQADLSNVTDLIFDCTYVATG